MFRQPLAVLKMNVSLRDWCLLIFFTSGIGICSKIKASYSWIESFHFNKTLMSFNRSHAQGHFGWEIWRYLSFVSSAFQSPRFFFHIYSLHLDKCLGWRKVLTVFQLCETSLPNSSAKTRSLSRSKTVSSLWAVSAQSSAKLWVKMPNGGNKSKGELWGKQKNWRREMPVRKRILNATLITIESHGLPLNCKGKQGQKLTVVRACWIVLSNRI